MFELMLPGFRATFTESQAMTMVALHGELDVQAYERFGTAFDALLDKRPLVISVDLRQLEFMDSSGLRVLVSAARRCQAAGLRFFLVRGSRQVSRLLEVSGLDSFFETVDAPEVALEVPARNGRRADAG